LLVRSLRARSSAAYLRHLLALSFFLFTARAPTDIYTLSLHDALPIYHLSVSLAPVYINVVNFLMDERWASWGYEYLYNIVQCFPESFERHIYAPLSFSHLEAMTDEYFHLPPSFALSARFLQGMLIINDSLLFLLVALVLPR